MSKSFKDNGTEWIGKVPEYWEQALIGSLYKLRNTKVSDKQFEPLSVTMRGILHQLENAAKTNDGDNRKLVRKGDFVINSRSDRRGACGISKYDGSVSLINLVLVPQNNMHPGYYDWLFHTTAFADEFYKWGHGIVDDLWTTHWQDMKNITIPVPPLPEQRRIADYLDKKCAEIDTLSQNIQQQIETLEQYKRAVITETVTKGIPSSVSMKNSGIPWIGQIPQHWEVKRTKFIAVSFEKGNGITKDDLIADGDIQCIRYGDIYSKYDTKCVKSLCFTNINKIEKPKYIQKGDILFAGTGELIEEIGKNIVYIGDKPCLAGGDIIILKHNQNPIFLNYVLGSSYVQEQKSFGKTKLKVVHISVGEIGNTIIALPPIAEQQAIADYLDDKCGKIDGIIQAKQQQLEILQQYKKAVIFEYVTGKKQL